ncbi:tRNA-(ms[2]io[6]A)-hydroxylase [Chondrinema litorale]|uniref:tRNA-(ms[2]io[6]A)-hydroxylase n=1 Tax=Chondrinema litorale TaxID=2994555 RepID=UPI002543CCCD|nr:tRNA-(ms[2]io[6]A)-hydroxylase [Chondrinema litorale]UZR96212.1 tRNA-(ms[2]io[6]A)-hydroxylase [Chondrinema litorale]
MLHLKLPTDPRWVNIAEKNIEDILIDHAYCEQKAASTCISLIVQYPEKDELVEMLTPVVAEEWDHFERVLKEMRKRGISLGKMRKDEYVNQLAQKIKKGGSREQQLVEKLLMSALIEARSCERFKLLWQNLEDENLKEFYYELMVSEAGHYTNFITLARNYLPREEVDKRWQELLKEEKAIIENLEPRSDRMH